MICVVLPAHVTFSGGGAAKVLPASAHSIEHAVAVIVNGGSPESKIGLDNDPFGGAVPGLNLSVAGSMAYCHAAVASNCRSVARGCCAFCCRTVWFLGISKA